MMWQRHLFSIQHDLLLLEGRPPSVRLRVIVLALIDPIVNPGTVVQLG